jgi:hypothetical protein
MTVTQVVIKFLNTNYIFLEILGRAGHDPVRFMTGHPQHYDLSGVTNTGYSGIFRLLRAYQKKYFLHYKSCPLTS